MIKPLSRFGHGIRHWLAKPGKVLIACVIFALLQLLIQGNIFHLLRLHSDRKDLVASLNGVQADLLKLETRIRQAKDPIFIEKEAKDRLDMAGEDELVFVFSSD